MKEKNKGFTLIELLAVIVVLAIIMVIATTLVSKQIKKSKKNANEINKEMIVKAVKTCLVENTEEECDTIEKLQKNGYLDSFEDPWNKKNDNLDDSYAIIINENKDDAKVIYQDDATDEEKEEIKKLRTKSLIEITYTAIENSKVLIKDGSYNTYNLRNSMKYNSNDYQLYVVEIKRDAGGKVLDRIPSSTTDKSVGLTEGVLVVKVEGSKSIYKNVDFSLVEFPRDFYKFQGKNNARICVVLNNDGNIVSKDNNPDYSWCQIVRIE